MKKVENGLVTVVITTYKRPIAILTRALNSAVLQTYRKIEIFVVNDAPEEVVLANEIKELVELYENVEYLSYECNKGACYARNYGAKYANGEFLSFLDDDDEWLPNKIERQLSRINNPEVGLVYSPYYEVDKYHKGKIMMQGTVSGKVLSDLLKTNIIGGCSMALIRKSVFDEVGGFNESLLASQDYDLWVKIAKRKEVEFEDTPLTKRFLMEDSISVNPKKKIQGWDYMLAEYNEEYSNNKISYNVRLNSIVEQSLEFGMIKYAVQKWKLAIMIRPISIENLRSICIGTAKLIRAKIAGRK